MPQLLTAFLAFLILLSSSFSVALASEQTLMTINELNAIGFVKYESLNPNSLAYPLKSIEERIKLSLMFNEYAQSRYSISLVNTRFRELVYIINFKKTGFLNEAVGRFNTQVGKIKLNSNLINSNYKNKYHKDMLILEVLRDKYPANSAYWLNIQQTIDTLRSII